MNREKAIDKVKSAILHNFASIGVGAITDDYTGETFISIDDDKIYNGQAFKDLPHSSKRNCCGRWESSTFFLSLLKRLPLATFQTRSLDQA